MKKCSKCGAKLQNNDGVCTSCGSSGTVSRASGGNDRPREEIAAREQPRTETVVQYQTVYVPQQNSVTSPGAMGKAVASLILGLAGLVISCMAPFLDGIPAVLGLLISIIGIVFAVKARNGIPVNASGRGVATAGMVFSVLGTIIGGMISLIFVCIVVGILSCVFSTPSASVDYYATASFIMSFII